MASDILTSKSPRLDVHGETYDSVSLYVTQFIDDNYKLRNKYIAIVHGKGEGILKKRVHELLKINKKVEDYYLNNWNIGETIIVLNVDKCSNK
ncbi:MAG: Smr/MutS family protein [Bacilli bacterium]|nr:Smr/MutS family protein [Bacilli bacterium]